MFCLRVQRTSVREQQVGVGSTIIEGGIVARPPCHDVRIAPLTASHVRGDVVLF